MPPALFDKFPELASRLSHRPLGQFPTPIEPLDLKLPGGGELWVKHEDRAAELYGGNKVRKLEFLLAKEPGRRLLTFGAFGSSHVVAIGLYGRQLGIKVDAVLVPQPMTARVGQAISAQLGAGVRLWPCRSMLGVPRAMWRARRAGSLPHLIPPGGSDELGTLGWWSGGLEIAAQVASGAAPPFDVVYLAFGSGGTTAGLLLGLGAATKKVTAVRVVPWPLVTDGAVKRIGQRCHAFLQAQLGQPIPLENVPTLDIERRFVGAGYGVASKEGIEATARAKELGLSLDPTYTAKAFAAVLSDAKSGRLAGKRALFIHSYNSADITALAAQGDLAKLPAWLRDAVLESRRDVIEPSHVHKPESGR